MRGKCKYRNCPNWAKKGFIVEKVKIVKVVCIVTVLFALSVLYVISAVSELSTLPGFYALSSLLTM